MTQFTGRETMREMREKAEGNDTSDEAFIEWYKRYSHDENVSPLHVQAWREAVRRCEVRMDTDRELIAAMKENYISLKARIEERERKAFEAAWTRGWEWDGFTLDEAYRAYREKEEA